MNRFHIASLDGIRGLAALFVFAFHAGFPLPGNFGVTVFFFLSGFLITTLLRTEIERTGSISLKDFYLRRVYRIAPPLYLVLGLAVLVAAITPREVDAGLVTLQFLQMTNYAEIFGDSDKMAPFTGPMWSLAVEEHFYLVFPLALLWLSRWMPLRRIAWVFAAACAAVLAWRFALVAMGVSSEYLYKATDARIDSILFGCIMGLWCNPRLDAPLPTGLSVALLGAGGLAILGSFALTGSAKDTIRYTIQGLGLFPIFYCAVRFNGWPIFRWLDSRLMRALGAISYTFYLAHIGFIRITDDLSANPWIVAGIAFVLTVCFAAATYFTIEQPVAKWRQRAKAKRLNIIAAGETSVPAASVSAEARMTVGAPIPIETPVAVK